MIAFLEGGGVILGLLYVILAIRENRLCWIAGAGASTLFLVVFWEAELRMQALLQIYYIAVAAHGWVHWGRPDAGRELEISSLTWRDQALCVGLLLLLSAFTLLLQDKPGQPTAVLDALTSWGGVLATWLVARKVLEAWLWWVAIDIATIALYLQADLLASSGLYALYTVLAFLGWKEWRKSYQALHSTPGAAPS